MNPNAETLTDAQDALANLENWTAEDKAAYAQAFGFQYENGFDEAEYQAWVERERANVARAKEREARG